jgi:hypothetical protein
MKRRASARFGKMRDGGGQFGGTRDGRLIQFSKSDTTQKMRWYFY